MLPFATDILAAFLIAKYLRSLWSQIPLAILAGIASLILAGLLAIFAGRDLEVVGLWILSGILIHPPVVLGSLWFFRRKAAKSKMRQLQAEAAQELEAKNR